MVTVVIVLNVLISLACLYVAGRVRKVGRQVNRAEKAIISAERVTYKVLHKAPAAIAKAEMGTRKIRQRYDQLEHQLQKAQQLLALLSLGQTLWQRRSMLSKRSPKT